MCIRKLSRIDIIILSVLATLAVLIGILGWLAATQSALCWGAKQIEARSQGAVSLSEVSGSLIGPLKIGKLSLGNEQRRIEAVDLSLEWSWRSLLHKHLQIDKLGARELRITELAPSTEPLTLPDSLRLPFTLSAPAITLDRLILASAGKETVLTNINLGTEQKSGSFGLTVRSLKSPWGSLQGDVRLSDLPPFDLSAKVELQQRGTLTYRVQARADGTLKDIRLVKLLIDLDKVGQLSGEGRFVDQNLQLALTTSGLNPQGLYSKLRSLKLAGEIKLAANAADQQLVVDLRTTQLCGYRLRLDARRRDQHIELNEIRLAAGSSHLNAKGSVEADGPLLFRLSCQLLEFNLANFGDFPTARINADFSGNGRLVEPQAKVEFSIGNSEFHKKPLTGHGKLSLSSHRLWDADLNLKLARNTLMAHGALGGSDDRLSFQVDAVDLSTIDPDFGGEAHFSGMLQGAFSALAGALNADVKNAIWHKTYRIGNLTASARIGRGGAGELALKTSGRGLITPHLRLEQMSLEAQGTRASHHIQLHATNRALDLTARLSGRWNDATGWAGQLGELFNRGTLGFALTSPTPLALAPQRMTLSDARITFSSAGAGAGLTIDNFAYDAGKLSSMGEFKGLPLAYLEKLTGGVEGLETDLTLGGQWCFAVGERVNGKLTLWREGGDLYYSQNPKIALGLTRLALDTTANDGRVQLSVNAEGAQLGNFKVAAQSRLNSRNGVWGFAGDAPVKGSAELAVKSLAWLQPLVGNAVMFDGALQAKVGLGGQLAQPALSGLIVGERFAIALPEQGIDLREGGFRASLEGQSLRLNELKLRGGSGSLNGTGLASLKNGSPTLQLALKAEKLEAISRPDRHLVISGSSDLSIAGNAIKGSAKIVADEGLIELPSADSPTLSDDVIILGQASATAPRPRPYTLAFDLDLDLGNKFFIKGKGLGAQIGGTLKLVSAKGALPSSRGSLRVVKGAYTAYGQRLDITRGILSFQGPLDNPGLNIIAMRTDQTVEAGVSVSGTAQSPQVRLISNPSLPDGEKLSWLVLGHGTEDSSAQEFSVLQAAAGALLDAGQSVTLQQRIAHAAGLEDVSLKGSGGLENTVLSLGKRLSSRAYLSYEQGLAGAGTLVKINYTLSKQLALRVQMGMPSALDLFYTISFD